MQKLLEIIFEVLGSNRALRVVGNGLLAEVIEGEGTRRREAAATGLLQDEPHQLQSDLGLALAQLHLDTTAFPGGFAGHYTGGGRALW